METEHLREAKSQLRAFQSQLYRIGPAYKLTAEIGAMMTRLEDMAGLMELGATGEEAEAVE